MINTMRETNVMYQGFKIIETPSMTVDRITKTKRGWLKRIFQGMFTSKWNPGRTHDEFHEKGLPDERLIITEDSIVGHPKTLQILYDHIEKQKNEKGA